MIRYLILIGGALLATALDQITKIWAARTLVLPDGQLPADAAAIQSDVRVIIEGWFNVRVAGNKGAAWGLFRDLPDSWRVTFFVVVGLVAIAIIVAFYRNAAGQRLLSAALVLILGGAVGNLLDRMRLGYVVDFIDWHHGAHHFPTFNVADVAISVGVTLLVADLILHRGERADDSVPID